ncbi:MAG: SAM-dependent methyltransferase [Polyangiaceae bacterium]|nr:SAM-dependent methyltransferase [Polyangiaceae bacterium]
MEQLIDGAIERRQAFVAESRRTPHPKNAFRLFDGFREGAPRFVLDVYGTSLVVFDHGDPEEEGAGVESARALADLVISKLPFLKTAVHKPKGVRDPILRRGSLLAGDEAELCRAIEEDGVRYAIRLLLHHDASFYLDTRNLRAFVREQAPGKRVLNAFAYTGSVGVAAAAAGAKAVVQTDRSKLFLNVAKDSNALNGLPVARPSFLAGDYFDVTAQLRKKNELFDLVILDPPLFADSARGRVDLEATYGRLVDKVRPVVGDGGLLVLVNNALFVSGIAFMQSIDAIVGQGYAKLEKTISVPEDCAPVTDDASEAKLPADPAPFNHATKIAVLRLNRRDARRAS